MAILITFNSLVPGVQGNGVSVSLTTVQDATVVDVSVVDLTVFITVGYATTINAGTWNNVATAVNGNSDAAALLVAVGTSNDGLPFLNQTVVQVLGSGSVGGGLGSFFFQIQGVTPPVVTTIPKPTAGGAKFIPRHLNKTLLLASIYRNLAPYVRGPYRSDGPRGSGEGYGFPAPLSAFYVYPNEFDLCLSRDFQVFQQIDPLALACGRKPECFLSTGSREWVEPPAGAITINRNEAIPLPGPLLENVVIFSLRVPYGYDGIILGQFHGFTGQFNQGSGDLVWRVRVNGRYLQDMGNMQLSIGTSRSLSPVSGGSMVKSGNLVEYLVSAPNTTGSLPIPGVGNVLAGLYGYFFPRK